MTDGRNQPVSRPGTGVGRWCTGILCAMALAVSGQAGANTDNGQGGSYSSQQREQASEQARTRLQAFRDSLCEQLDTSMTLEDNPFVYHNPDAGCDLGFEMPGLPSIDGALDGLDSCKMLQSVTGETVDNINRRMEGAVGDVLGDDRDLEVDLGDAVGDRFEDDVSGGQVGGSVSDALRDAF